MKLNFKTYGNPLWKNETIESVHIELTDKCNSGCPMCPRYIDQGAQLNPLLPNAEITLEQFKNWLPVEFIQGLSRFYACGNYGDPIAAKDTLAIYQYIRSINPNTGLAMHTNGGVRNPEWWYELGKTMNISARGDYCTFSIDGLEDTNHLYRRKTNFKRIMENVREFLRAGGVAHWDFIVFDYNEHQVEEARSLAKEMGFENFNIKRTTRWYTYNEGRGAYEVKNRKGEVEYTLRQPLNEELKHSTWSVLQENLQAPNYVTEQEYDKMTYDELTYNMENPNGAPEKVNYSKFEIGCRAAKGPRASKNEIFVSATGHLFPCCFLGGEPWRHIHGTELSKDNFMKMVELNGGMDSIDLHKHSLADIMASPIYSELLARSFNVGHPMRSRQCATCCGVGWNKLDFGELGSKNSSYFDEEKNSGSLRES